METMQPRFGPFDERALAVLDEYLASEKVPERVTLDHLDGYLAAVAVGPELIMPGEWLALIWDGEEPRFDNPDEANAVISAIIGRHNQIIEQVQRGEFAPLFRKSVDGDSVVDGWAEGFLSGVLLRLEAWAPLFQDEEQQGLLVPILGLCSGEHGDLLGLDPDEKAEIARDAPEMIPECVEQIYAFWNLRAARSES